MSPALCVDPGAVFEVPDDQAAGMLARPDIEPDPDEPPAEPKARRKAAKPPAVPAGDSPAPVTPEEVGDAVSDDR
jgi:hypothetical protein